MGRKIDLYSINAATSLNAIGQAIRSRRKELKLTAEEVARAAGISRVTLHRIEKGESSVTVGAYAATLQALGLGIGVTGLPAEETPLSEINVDNYPELRKLAWQIATGTVLTPEEAWDIYSRNWRHLDEENLTREEAGLFKHLNKQFSSNSAATRN